MSGELCTLFSFFFNHSRSHLPRLRPSYNPSPHLQFFFLSPLFFLSFFLFFPFLLALSIRRRRRSQISSLTSPKPASYRLRSSSVSQWRSYRFRIQGIKDLSITILNIRSCSNGEKGTVSDWILRVLYSCYRYEHLTIRMLGVD